MKLNKNNLYSMIRELKPVEKYEEVKYFKLMEDMLWTKTDAYG